MEHHFELQFFIDYLNILWIIKQEVFVYYIIYVL